MAQVTPEPHAQATSREEVLRALDAFNTGMLVTLTPEGVVRSRPMQIAGHDEEGRLWFVTGSHSGKVEEVATFERAAVVFQSPRLYLSLTGEAHIVDDRERIQSLWRESWRTQFPNGPLDDSLVLIEVVPRSADLWDLRGISFLRQMWHAARTWLSGGSIESHALLQHQHTAL